MNARNTGLGKTVGQPLERNEMQNILAGFTPHECNCYCCDGEEQLDTPIMHLEGAGCDAGGGVESHQACKDACETSGFVTNMCDNNGGEICALCESDDYPG